MRSRRMSGQTDRWRFVPWGMATWSSLWLVSLSAQALFAQFPMRATSTPIVNRILMLAPREYQQQLRRAEEAIEREQFSEAIQTLAQLLETSILPATGFVDGIQEDFFIGHPSDTQLNSSLRSEARRLLGSLPARGKELYRLNFGAEAQRRFDRALADRDESLLAEVARRYFHTDAGYLASMLLGRHHLDRGQPLAAAICFSRIAETKDAAAKFDPELTLLLASSWYQAGNSERARDVLKQLKKRQPSARFSLGTRTVSLFHDAEDPLTWLEQQLPASDTGTAQLTVAWQMHRGLPSRNPTSIAGAPLLYHRWRVPLASTPDDEEQIESILMERRERGVAPIPTVTPLVVDDVVLVRTPENMLAVDFETGKRIWEYPWADPPSAMVSESVVPARNRQQRRHQLEERLWMDSTYGQLSSDGKCVFLVDELSYVSPAASDAATRVFRNALPRAGAPKEYNSLVALEMATQGKYRWRVGGVEGEDEPALAQAFFLGPPLVLADALYVLAEVRGDISLFALDANTGQLRWSQQLAHVGALNIVQDVTRRLAGASPSYSDGVLICPTSAGAIVAVDIPTRSLLWGYQYPRSFTLPAGGIRINFARARTRMRRDRDTHWLDAAALIADGRVIVTPIESDQLICLDLLTGEPLWSVDRDDDLLMTACLYDGQAIVIANSKVVSFNLKDGSARWELPIADSSNASVPTERPAGRGFLTDNHYYLPTTHRLLTIDLDRGQIDSALVLSQAIGNLVPYGDQIVSLAANSLATFYQADRLEEAVKRRLAAHSQDPWAMEHRGLLQLKSGDRLAALQSLRDAYRAYAADDDRREGTRVLLVETLLAELEEDDDGTNEIIREVDALIERPLQRERYLRLAGKRMLRAGRAVDAFEAFLELAHQQDSVSTRAVFEDPRMPLVEAGSRDHLVRRDRFVRSGIREALQMANAAERAQLDQLVLKQYEQATATGRISRLHEFLKIFADHSSADSVRLALAERYLEIGEYLQVELILSPMLSRPATEQSGIAWLLMARTMQSAGRTEMLRLCLEQLSTNASSQVLPGGKTGSEWAESLGADRRLSLAMADWPYGRVQVERLTGSPSNLPNGFQSYSNYRPIRLRSRQGVLPARLQVAYDSTGTNSIVIVDSLGREQCRIPGTSGRIKRFVDGTLTAKSLGHLVLINFGHGVLAADALSGGQRNDQRVLWPRNYTELLDGADPRRSPMNSSSRQNEWGQPQFDVTGRRVHTIGPVSVEGVVYLQGNSLYCVDPLNGYPLWIRHDVPARARVWGDEHYVFVASQDEQNNGKARVFRLLDGDELEPRDIPPLQTTWSTFGRLVLTWDNLRPPTGNKNQSGRRRLRMFDPWTQRDVWLREFDAKSRGQLTPDGQLAIVSPDHHFQLLDAASGAILIEHSLEPVDRPMLSVYWRPSTDQSLLIRRFEPRARKGSTIESFPNPASCPLIDGDVYAFDQSGRSLWPVPAVIEDYGLPLDQPADVPVLAFVRKVSRKSSRSRRPTLSIMCIDKRDGRLLLEADNLNFSFGSFFMSGNPQQDTVSLRLLNAHNYLLTFTDEPQPPAPPAQTGTAASPRGGTGLSRFIGDLYDKVGRKLENVRSNRQKADAKGKDDEKEKKAEKGK